MVQVDVIATFSGAIIGAVVGSLGNYFLRKRTRREKKQEQIENLRRSLVAELGSMDEFVNYKASNYSSQVPGHDYFSTEVYRANSADISLLTSEEAEAVIRFYSGAIRLEETIDKTREFVFDSEHPSMHDMTPINETIDILRDEWKNCVLALIRNLDDYPSAIRVDGERITVDESISSADLWAVLRYKEFEDTDIEVIE